MDLGDSHDEFVDDENISDPDELFNDDDDGEHENVDSLEHRNDASDKNDIRNDKKKESESKPVKRKIVRNPRVVLNFDRLKSDNGIPALIKIFDKFKFKGRHHEKEDLTALMQNMQHWMCNVLYPGYDMETCMKALEKLGRKRIFQTYMKRERNEAKTNFSNTRENSTNSNIDIPSDMNEAIENSF